MKRRNILGLSLITALGLALLPSSAVSQQKSLKDQLVGTWTLVSWERVSGPSAHSAQSESDRKLGDNRFHARPECGEGRLSALALGV